MSLSCRRLASFCARTPEVTLSMIDMGNGLGRWKSIPTRRRSDMTSTSGAQMLRRSSSTSPVWP
jgi:hypothetical protein